jgi:hypothetical protein
MTTLVSIHLKEIIHTPMIEDVFRYGSRLIRLTDVRFVRRAAGARCAPSLRVGSAATGPTHIPIWLLRIFSHVYDVL